ncbi:MAG: hypothetical protein Q9222_007707 [Ikaeria aurantiellina]
MRELYMKSGQGFLLVFSITSLSSLTELHELRDQIVRIKDDPQVPLVIVGNKSDLEEDRVVSRARAFATQQPRQYVIWREGHGSHETGPDTDTDIIIEDHGEDLKGRRALLVQSCSERG